jgi:hypothetical protein
VISIWNQNTAKDWLIFPELRQTFIDRRNGSSNGELYTILTNKAAKGKKGTLVAMIAGTSGRHNYYYRKYRLNYEIQFLR